MLEYWVWKVGVVARGLGCQRETNLYGFGGMSLGQCKLPEWHMYQELCTTWSHLTALMLPAPMCECRIQFLGVVV